MEVKHYIAERLRDITARFLDNNSYYSQEGEDLIISKILWQIPLKGFFIDIGAHHPVKYSNTYFFYKRGWRGVNIDAMPGSMKLFSKIRPEDINVECPISDERTELKYYSFNHPELNTFVESHAEEWKNKEGIEIIGTQLLHTSTLNDILQDNNIGPRKIDILSIDVEGMDFTILKSIDFESYPCEFIIIEEAKACVEEVINGQIYNFLTPKKYRLIAKLHNSSIYRLYA